MTAFFTDPAGIHDKLYSCQVDFGDSSGVVAGIVRGYVCDVGEYYYQEPGVYTIIVTITDKDGHSGSSTATTMLVIYDPDGDFVTGGGWIWSEAGSCQLDTECEGAEGKANFGFVSKYKKGASVPTGNTQFQFKAGNLNFHSSSYDWLVVTGSDYAKYKGTGTINGEGEYKFKIWAGDDEPDTFRIKVWWEDTDGEHVVYDNGMDQEIGGGNIVVHTSKR